MRPLRIFLFFLVVVLTVSVYRLYSHIDVPETNSPPVLAHGKVDADSLVCAVTVDTLCLPALSRVDSGAMLHREVQVESNLESGDSTNENGIIFNEHLLSFYAKLKPDSKHMVRVVYYGDSQIEGDHVSYSFRKKMQARFGGAGIGFLPVQMYFNTTHNLAVVTNDFERHTVKYGDHKTDNYGLYGQYFELSGDKGTLRLLNRNHDESFRNMAMLSSGFSVVKFYADKKLVAVDTLSNAEFEYRTFVLDETPGEIKIYFSEARNFRLYGVLLESGEGVGVDNVAFRGNLSLMAYRFGNDLVREMNETLHADLLILHFGLNVIPDNRPNYESYRVAVERDINALRKNMPSASVLVVGASDMAHKVDGEVVSYRNIDQIIEAQKRAAGNCGAAFWDMREAMGGEGAIASWVEKGYARSDYAHLTLAGSNLVGEILGDDLLRGWQHYSDSVVLADSLTLVETTINTK